MWKNNKEDRATGIRIFIWPKHTVFENHPKSRIQHCERSELRLHFEWTKVHLKCQKWSILASFWKPAACGQIVLLDRAILKGQKLLEMPLSKSLRCDFLGDFQTLCQWWFCTHSTLKSTKCNCVSRLVFSHCYYSLIFFSCNLIITF